MTEPATSPPQGTEPPHSQTQGVELGYAVPAKFQNEDGSVNVQALLKSQQDAESALSRLQRGQQPPAPAAQPQTPQTPQTPPGSIEEVVTRAGLDYQAVAEQFAQTGHLSEGSYKAIEASGLGRGVIDQTLSALQASRAQAISEQRTAGIAVFGSEEQLDVALKTGGALSESQKEAFRALVKDPSSRKQGFEFLRSAIANISGQSQSHPHVAGNQPPQSPSAAPFTRQSDLAAAYAYCKNTRAANYDHAHAQHLAARINATQNAGGANTLQ